MNTNEANQTPEFNLKQALLDALQTIPTNLSAVANNVLDPLGLSIDNSATEQAVKTNTFSAMQHSFDGKAGAFAYLLFILLYAPCVAATAAIYRETNLGWTVFVVLWTTGLAYSSATIFYQLARYNQHPQYSLAWIMGLALVFIGVLLSLWLIGKKPIQKNTVEVLP
jgi:ferrous iron transport protein B